MRRPHSMQPGDFGHSADPSRSSVRLHAAGDASNSGNNNSGGNGGGTFAVPSPSALGMSGTVTDHARYPSVSNESVQSDGRRNQGILGPSAGASVGESSSGSGTSGNAQFPFAEGSNLGSRGHYDDPGSLALTQQPHDLYSTGIDLSFDTSTHSSFAPGVLPAGASSHMGNAVSDLDLASSGMLQFPELPASLLDQGPEYEYVSESNSSGTDDIRELTFPFPSISLFTRKPTYSTLCKITTARVKKRQLASLAWIITILP